MIGRVIFEQARRFVSSELGSDSSGHGYWHAMRFSNTARRIAIGDGADPDVCELAALLHAMPDDKRGIPEEQGVSMLKGWLLKAGIQGEVSAHIIRIIGTMSF